MMKYASVLAVFLWGLVLQVLCRDDVLNTCIDARYHKLKPEPEPKLYGECAPWRPRACCEDNSTIVFHHSDTWLDFKWDHCPGHNLSDACRTHFLRDLCFYECSPNTGPWIQKQSLKIRNERTLNMPLCQSECNAWWDACKNDFTCLGNWGKGFNWTTGTNKCPSGSTCQPFTAMFGNATNFCNMVWDHSWRVVPDSQQCLKLNFTGNNPNDAVARYYASLNSGSSQKNSLYAAVVTMVSVMLSTKLIRI